MNPENAAWVMLYANEFRGGRLLEVGSLIVSGQERIALRNDLQSVVGEYVGLDMREGNGVDVIMDAKDMSYEDGHFDVIVSLDTLEHVDWPREVVRECARVLKPGGLFLLATVFDFQIHDYPSDFWRFTPACLQLLVEDAGLEIVNDDLTPVAGNLKPMVVHVAARKPE